MYKIKTLAQRGSAFVAAVGLLSGVVTSALPALASANALNPLTERSLTLSSSSPGYHYLDGSGNSTYAPPGSGNNGQKTGETFTFKISTDSTGSGPAVKAFTFQYCTSPAGNCLAPGNDLETSPNNNPNPGVDGALWSDLNAHYTSPVKGTDFDIEHWNGSAWVNDNTLTGADWAMTVGNLEDPEAGVDPTTKNNLITLTNATGLKLAAGTKLRVTFKATPNNYITNPGKGAFFVKINDYDTDVDDTNGDTTGGDLNPTTANNTHIVDGGVTVANVMNDSIQIQTKVLETMSFSVGTVNPDKVAAPGNDHGTCDSIKVNAPLNLGDSGAEYSLKDSRAYDVHSYWRLSSNSSGGATVYYSGNTLSNTVGDQIDAIGTTAKLSHPGTEQFGLALEDDELASEMDSFMQSQITADAAASPAPQYPHRAPHLSPLWAAGGDDGNYVTGTDYAHGSGGINSDDAGGITALLAFDPNSLTVAVPIASESDNVVDCATGKMRYVANIAATTPAGVYTSRINYVAAPQY
jgi:hypothetical protein